jgi:Replicase family
VLPQLSYNRPRRVTDAEAQHLIATASNNFDTDFFYDNNSSLTLVELFDYFCDLFPSPYILCGYQDNRDKKFVPQGVLMRKINLRAIPVGKNLDLDEAGKPVGGWHKVYADLPAFMAFDVDENDKPQFRQLFPDYRCYEIHDALDIARPLCITINPVSWNCQYLYVMKWTAEDAANTQAAMVEYERVRKELSLLLGADPKFVNHVVRSPWYIAGHHRDNPNRTTSKKLIEVGKESLWHYSKWYEPKAYTLAELRELVAQLRELHSFLGNAVPGV